MDHLKEGIGLRGYGQKDPLVEYKKESYVLFQDMMDRIEDETVRYLFFLQRSEGPVDENVPHPELWSEEDQEGGDAEAVGVAAGPTNEQRQIESRAAQSSVMDFTRKIEKKKEREMAELQFVGGESSTQKQPVLAKKQVGRNDPCPCGSGKKYKKCCGS
jgi:preprotein translocase subunit SecA